jgi:hypothetical protein
LSFSGLDQVNVGIFQMVNGKKAHMLYNVMTMSLDIRKKFDSLALWFEATVQWSNLRKLCAHLFSQDDLDVYKVVTPGMDAIERKSWDIPDQVTFESSHPELMTPDHGILKLHTVCSEVAHLSGAAEYIEQVLDDIDEGATSVLAEDGSSFALQMAFARHNIIYREHK